MKKSGLKREDIFLETKIWPSFYENEDAVEKTLERLDTDYIDLLLIHQPAGNYIAGYRLMEKAYKEGKVKAIGLSNFNREQIQEILDTCEVAPAILQTEVHPYSQEKELKEFLDKNKIVIQAWYPLGHGDRNLIEEDVFAKLAEKYGKTNVQIILRWHVQPGNTFRGCWHGSKTEDKREGGLCGAVCRDTAGIYLYQLLFLCAAAPDRLLLDSGHGDRLSGIGFCKGCHP